MTKAVRLFAMVMVLAGCAQRPPGPPAGPGGDKIELTGDQKADWAQIIGLENQAKSLIRTAGCALPAQCRTAPVGSKACGGPRYYLVYCSLTTDSAALFRKLDAIAAVEREYNTRYQIVSTCEFRVPPSATLSGGYCQAQ